MADELGAGMMHVTPNGPGTNEAKEAERKNILRRLEAKRQALNSRQEHEAKIACGEISAESRDWTEVYGSLANYVVQLDERVSQIYSCSCFVCIG
jgi:hypothetical protein